MFPKMDIISRAVLKTEKDIHFIFATRQFRTAFLAPLAWKCLLVGLSIVISFNLYSQDALSIEKSSSRRVGFIMPFEFDFDYGAPSGNAVIGRFLPVLSIPIGKRWSYRNITLAAIADAPGGRPGFPGNPEPIAGDRVTGLGDWINISLFFPPVNIPTMVLGFGFAVGLPFATDPLLGSQKWTFGPAFRFGYRPGKWRLNFLMGNLGSFTGSESRNEVHQFILRALIRRPLWGKWYITSDPIITANWNAEIGQRWLVPLGCGIGRIMQAAKNKWSMALHFYHNAIKPDGAPNGLFRIDILYKLPSAN